MPRRLGENKDADADGYVCVLVCGVCVKGICVCGMCKGVGIPLLPFLTPLNIASPVSVGEAEAAWGRRSGHAYHGPVACLRDLYRRGGVAGCYAGLGSMTVR